MIQTTTQVVFLFINQVSTKSSLVLYKIEKGAYYRLYTNKYKLHNFSGRCHAMSIYLFNTKVADGESSRIGATHMHPLLGIPVS